MKALNYTFEREYEYFDNSISFSIIIKKNSNTIAIDKETLYPHTAGILKSAWESTRGGRIDSLDGFDISTHYKSTSSNLVAIVL